MTDIDVYQIFSAIRLHFKSASYDYFKYNGKTRVKAPKSGERAYYMKLAYKFKTRREVEDFFLANALEENLGWIGGAVGAEGFQHYRDYLSRVEALTYYFIRDVKTIFRDCDYAYEAFTIPVNSHSKIVTHLIAGDIHLESFVLLNKFVPFIDSHNQKFQARFDPIWPTIYLKAIKYEPFLKRIHIVDTDLRKKIVSTFKELGVQINGPTKH